MPFRARELYIDYFAYMVLPGLLRKIVSRSPGGGDDTIQLPKDKTMIFDSMRNWYIPMMLRREGGLTPPVSREETKRKYEEEEPESTSAKCRKK